MQKVEYPKWKYHGTRRPRKVNSPEEEKELGEGWGEKAAYREIAGDVEARDAKVKLAREDFHQRLEEKVFNDPTQDELDVCWIAPDLFQEELESYADNFIGIWSEDVELPNESEKVLFRGTLFRAGVKPLVTTELSRIQSDLSKYAGLGDKLEKHLNQMKEAAKSVRRRAWRQLFPSSGGPEVPEERRQDSTELTSEESVKSRPKQPANFLQILKSKGTFTMKEAAKICGVEESTVRKTMIEPNGPLKMAGSTKRITAQSIADHLGVSLEGK